MTQTLYADFVNLEAYIDAGILEVLRTNNVMLNNMYTVNLPKGSDSKKLRKKNAQTAAVVAEGVAATAAKYSHSAMSTLTAKKAVVLNEVTEETELFANVEWDELRVEQGLAIAEKVDTDSCALFTGFTNSASATGVALTIPHLVEAAYKAGLSYVPGGLIYVLSNIQVYHLESELVTAGASIWANPNTNNLLDGKQPAMNGFRGNLLGRPVFQTDHVPTSGGDRVGACLNPMYALATAVVKPADTIIDREVTARVRYVNSAYYYDVKERLDGAGCRIISVGS